MPNAPELSLGLDLAPAAPASRALPVLEVQKDIEYREIVARAVLNDPATTRMGCWSLNPYVGCAFGCAYCYARYTHRYVSERDAARGDDANDELPPWLAFERRIRVKRDAPALVRRALASASARYDRLRSGEEWLVVGTATDPYQPAERRFGVTRGVLEALAEHPGLRLTIITKSPLVARDADLLARIAAGGAVSIHMSLITLDRALARRIEPRAPTPESRLRAVARLAEAGIDVGINLMPVLPGITDGPGIEALVRRASEAGAVHLAAGALRLESTARSVYLPWIATEFPALRARYAATFARSADVGAGYRTNLRERVAALCERYGIRFRSYNRETGDQAPTPPPIRVTDQLTLGI